MKLIIPMAGMGKRMRPHTLTTPKPLIPLAGKPIVEHLIEEIAQSIKEPIQEIAFIIGAFGEEVENTLLACASKVGAKGHIYYQEEALGTAHAILCAAPSLQGPVIVAFADTLFFSHFQLGSDKDAIIWTKKVEDPSAFGVVLTDEKNKITGFTEKPKNFVSNLAIIGIYYFKDGENLRKELQYLIDADVRKGKEYQLTDALQNMMEKGLSFYSQTVDQWLDCGNKNATVETNSMVLRHKSNAHFIHPTVEIIDSVIIPPCYIGPKVVIKQSVVGPCVSVGDGSVIARSLLSDSIVQSMAEVENVVLSQSMIGNHANIHNKMCSVNLGDFSESDF